MTTNKSDAERIEEAAKVLVNKYAADVRMPAVSYHAIRRAFIEGASWARANPPVPIETELAAQAYGFRHYPDGSTEWSEAAKAFLAGDRNGFTRGEQAMLERVCAYLKSDKAIGTNVEDGGEPGCVEWAAWLMKKFGRGE